MYGGVWVENWWVQARVSWEMSRSMSLSKISDYETKLIPKNALQAKLNELYYPIGEVVLEAKGFSGNLRLPYASSQVYTPSQQSKYDKSTVYIYL